jgi:translation initiation factor IF-2
MMNPAQYPGMRYSGQYPGMEFPQPAGPHMHPMHPHQHQRTPNTSTPTATTAASQPEDLPTPVSEDASIAQSEQNQSTDIGDANPAADPQHPPGNGQSPQRPLQPPPPAAGHPMPHAMPMQPHMYYPGGYYNPTMGIFPPQHGGPPHQYGPPHMAVHMPRQMYNGPGMPAVGMPPNMMRGPPAYYSGPNGPVSYPQYGAGGGAYAEEETMIYGGRGRGGRGAGRGGRNSGRGQGRGTGGGRGGGRGRYNHQYSGGSSSLGDSGRETPQGSTATPPLAQTAASSGPDTSAAGTAGDKAITIPVAPSNNVSEAAPVPDTAVATAAASNAEIGK